MPKSSNIACKAILRVQNNSLQRVERGEPLVNGVRGPRSLAVGAHDDLKRVNGLSKVKKEMESPVWATFAMEMSMTMTKNRALVYTTERQVIRIKMDGHRSKAEGQKPWRWGSNMIRAGRGTFVVGRLAGWLDALQVLSR